MSHQYRFLGRILPEDTCLWELSAEEARHLKKVLRLQEGARVGVFDGKGSSGEGIVEKTESDGAVVRVDKTVFHRAPKRTTLIGIGALKPGFIDDLLPSLSEQGIQEIHVFLQEGVAKARMQEKTRARWDKILISSAKQCRRHYLPVVRCWASLGEFLGHVSERFNQGFYLQAGPYQGFGRQVREADPAADLCAVIGGEKGFSAGETQLLQNSFLKPASLGTLIMRAFTAALSAGALLSEPEDSPALD